VPAIDLVRRIAARMSVKFVVQFTYEDVSGRNIAADAHTLLREKLGDKDSTSLKACRRNL
jgi:hypothetical protein